MYTGAWDRILAAINKAGSLGIGVLVDLHAAAGAQNTDAHSGLSEGKIGFWKSKNLKATSTALRFLVSQLAQNPHVIGIELLNEPADNAQLKDWYDRTLGELRGLCDAAFPLYMSDAWQTDFYAGYVGGRGDFVVLDDHLYRCFTDEDKRLTGYQHADKLLHSDQGQMAGWAAKCHGQWVVGEWSAGLDDAAAPGMPDGEKDANKRAFVKAELEVFQKHTAGYFFWTLKTDRPWDAGWSAQNASQAEILPASVHPQLRVPDPSERDGARQQATGEWRRHAGAAKQPPDPRRDPADPQTSTATTGRRTTATRNPNCSPTASRAGGTTRRASCSRETRSASGGRGRAGAQPRSASQASPRRGSGTAASSRASRRATARPGSTTCSAPRPPTQCRRAHHYRRTET